MDAEIAVLGAGVVGSATALALARRGRSVVLLEAEAEPGLGASGTNSGILHTGFDSAPGELETRLILRSASLRGELADALGLTIERCGAIVQPLDPAQRQVVTELARNAEINDVQATLAGDGSLAVPGESITDPAEFTRSLAAAAQRHGAELRTHFRVVNVDVREGGLEIAGADGSAVSCELAVNCAGLRADEVARMAGDHSFEIYPRKGEFLVLEPPADAQLDRILLPAPTKRTKGVLVFPTVDGKVVAGPTAVDQSDKDDRSVRDGAAEEILPKARAMWPPLEGAGHVASYAGLRPAGRGVNYLIGPSAACPALVNVAAIRSTGLSASLGIAEHVCEIIASMGIALGPEQPLVTGPAPRSEGPWWRQAADRRAA